MEGLESLGVGLGVNQVRAPVVAHLGRYKFAGERAHRRSPSWTRRSEEIEVGGLKCECQRVKECQGLSTSYLNIWGPLCKIANAGARGGAFPPSVGWFEPITVNLFPFLFLPGLGDL
jgi:hypothetical protein